MIDEETVESTWREVAQTEPRKAHKLIIQLSRKQPALPAFIMARTSELSTAAQELAVYMFVVIHRMFEKRGKKIRRISERDIL